MKRATTNHLKYLNDLKKLHSKSKNLSCEKVKQAEYIENTNFSTKEKRLLFKLRSKTLDVKMNFPGPNANFWCTSCGLFPESQGHLLQCPAIVVHLGYIAGRTSKLNENLIYGKIEQQKVIIKIYSDILEIRENLPPMRAQCT